ncbi:MAG: transposase [Nitrososphaera sp.]|nr:transposase [Nitrososphaera sp.]
MTNSTTNSFTSIHDLRCCLWLSLPSRSDALLNILDSLTAGPRILTPAELALCPTCSFEPSSIYSALRGASSQASLDALRRARLDWWERYSASLYEPDPRTGDWRVRVLDSTAYPRPRTKTVELAYVHTPNGMKPGHSLSVLSERVADGSWFLPLSIEVAEPTLSPTQAGVAQVLAYVTRYGWEPEDVLAVDAAYTNEPTLRPLYEAEVNVIGRVSSRRVFYLPPPPYSGFGRPRVRGRKIKLSDERTLPEASDFQRVELESGGWLEISQYADVRMRKWPKQPLALYRVWEYTPEGKKKYKRALWLIYVGKSEAPRPAEAAAIYDLRFGIEHSLRFMKREMTLDKGQFNGEQALERVRLWVEIVATTMWMLFAMRSAAKTEQSGLPKWWRSKKLTPGAVRRLALGVSVKLGISPDAPQVRGKSPGREEGTRLEPRKRYKVRRKRNKRARR